MIQRGMAWLVLLAASLVFGAAACVPAAAEEAPVEWKGFINCGILPGLTHYNLHAPISLVLTGHHATLERHVLRADTTQETRFEEHTSGEVSADGHVTLTGGATVGRRLSYNSTYTGQLPPSGGTTSLIGSQIWIGDPLGRYDRPCHIDLSR